MPIKPSSKNHIDSLFYPTSAEQWNSNAGEALKLSVSFTTSDTRFPDIDQKVTSIVHVTSAEQENSVRALKTWEHVAQITDTDQSGLFGFDVVIAHGDPKEKEGAETQIGGIQLSLERFGNKSQASVYIDPAPKVAGPIVPGSYGYAATVHELGHAIGLKHPGNFNAGDPDPHVAEPYLPLEQQNRDYSAMAYTKGDQAIGGNDPVTPMAYDIAAVQYLYGANLTYHAGETDYALERGKKMTVKELTGPDAGKTEVIEGGAMTIWDAGATDANAGIDTLRVPADYAGETMLDLRPSVPDTINQGVGDGLYYSAIGDTRVFNAIVYDDVAKVKHGELENAVGGKGNDRLTGNARTNTLTGNEGNDILTDGAGSDHMEGGPGNDRYVWQPSSGDVDHIVDTDNQGVIVAGLYSLEADFVKQADGTLRYDDPTKGERALPTMRLNGSQLEMQDRTPTNDGGHLIVENMPAEGALGMNFVLENCDQHTGPDPTCGADTIIKVEAATLDTGSGNDRYDSQATGNVVDKINLGSGADWAHTGGGNDEIHGGTGSDYIEPGPGSDVVFGDEGDDFIFALNDPVDTGSTDQFHGGPGNDRILAGMGVAVRLNGDEGDDYLYAKGTGNPNDTELIGGLGNDVLVLDGSGVIYDGSGNNQFIINIDALRSTGGNLTINHSAPIPDERRETYDTQTVLLTGKPLLNPVTVAVALEKGLIVEPTYNGAKTRLEIHLPSSTAADANMQAQEVPMIIIENFYEGWGGIRGVEGAPLAPWETQTEIPADPITPTVPTTPVVPITNSIYLPTIQTKAQTPHSDGQAMDTRHPMEVAHPDHVAYTVAMPYNDMAIAAAGVLPAVVYGGRALTRSLPPQAVRPIHQAINSLQTEIDVARVRADWALQDAKEWLQERLGQGRDSA